LIVNGWIEEIVNEPGELDEAVTNRL